MHPNQFSIIRSFSFGGKCALVSAVPIFFYLCATILLVGGHGDALAVSKWTAAYLRFIERQLGVPDKMVLLFAVFLGTVAVFVVASLGSKLFLRRQAAYEQEIYWFWLIGYCVFAVGVLLLVVRPIERSNLDLAELSYCVNTILAAIPVVCLSVCNCAILKI